MAFLKRLFEVKNAPLACALWATAIFAALVAEGISTSEGGLRREGERVTLAAEQTMLFRLADDDVRKVTLPAGDSVRVVGISKGTYELEYLVEDARGNRGWLQADQLPIRAIVTKGEHEGDTVSLTGRHYTTKTSVNASGYYINGGEEYLGAKYLVPELAGWEDLVLQGTTTTSVGTTAKVRGMVGRSLEQIESEIGPAYQVLHQADSTLARFRMSAIDTGDGSTFRPTFTFNAQGVATGVSFEYVRDRSDWLLRSLPGAGFIINRPLTSVLVRSNIYAVQQSLDGASFLYKVGVWCLVVLQLLVYALWMFFTPSLLVLVLGWLIRFPRLFFVLGDRTLKGIILVVSVLGFYWWSVVLLAWGLFWPFLFILFLVSRYMFSLSTCVLCQSPHIRCPHCRRLYTITFDHDEFVETTYAKGADIVKGRLLDTDTSQYKTWNRVTTVKTYSNGLKETSHRDEDIKYHKVEHRTYEMLNYEVTYKIDHYLSHYICRRCGFEETLPWVKWTEVDRKYVGTTTDTEDWEV